MCWVLQSGQAGNLVLAVSPLTYKVSWKVLLVVGGHSDSCRNTQYCNEYGWLTSTEIHRVGDPAWRQVAPLQHSLQKPAAVTLDNNVFLTGHTEPSQGGR